MQEPVYCQFSFHRLRPSWHQMAGPDQTDHLEELELLLTRYRQVRVDHLLPEESDPECDFVLRCESSEPHDLEGLVQRMQGLDLFRHIETIKRVKGRTREPQYISPTQAKELERRRAVPDLKRYAFLFLISRTSDWWHFPEEERRSMVREHVSRGMDYNETLFRRCYYSEGLDVQQDFIYYIESHSAEDVRDAYEQMKGLRDANYWARHQMAFRGRPVTLAEWEDQLSTGFGRRAPGPEAGPELRPPAAP